MDIFAQTVAARPGLAYVVGLGTPPARDPGPGTSGSDDEGASSRSPEPEPAAGDVPGPDQGSEIEHGETGI